MTAATAAPKQGGSLLDKVEALGNKVPHPVLMFLYLIIGVIVLSTILAFFNVQVTETITVQDNPTTEISYYEDTTVPIVESQPPYGEDWHLQETTIAVHPLLSVDGIRFMFTSFVPNFTGFSVVGIAFVALLGAGVAERAGLMSSLIRLLVAASPRRALAFVLIFVGVLASIATDAGYLILVPLGAAAFASVGRHPLAGLAACFAGVGAIFGVNLIPGPVDAQVVAITNEALSLTNQAPQTIVSNWFFSVISSIVLAVVAAIVTERIVEKRLGPWTGVSATAEAEATETAAGIFWPSAIAPRRATRSSWSSAPSLPCASITPRIPRTVSASSRRIVTMSPSTESEPSRSLLSRFSPTWVTRSRRS